MVSQPFGRKRHHSQLTYSNEHNDLFFIYKDIICQVNSLSKTITNIPCFHCEEIIIDQSALATLEHLEKHAQSILYCRYCKCWFSHYVLYCDHFKEPENECREELCLITRQNSQWTRLFFLACFNENGKYFKTEKPIECCQMCILFYPEWEMINSHQPHFIDEPLSIEKIVHILDHLVYFRFLCTDCLHKKNSKFIKVDGTFNIELLRECSIPFPNRAFIRKHYEQYPHQSNFNRSPNTIILRRFMLTGFIENFIHFNLTPICTSIEDEVDQYTINDVHAILYPKLIKN